MQKFRDDIKALQTEALNSKTKEAAQKCYDKIRTLKSEAWEILDEQASKYGVQVVKGTVRTFMASNDYFLVDTLFGTMWVSPTCDELSKSWYPHTCCVEYSVGQTIYIEVAAEVNLGDLSLSLRPVRMAGGTINEAQYKELCQRDDLAFFKYPGSDE